MIGRYSAARIGREPPRRRNEGISASHSSDALVGTWLAVSGCRFLMRLPYRIVFRIGHDAALLLRP
jgi:hypothetical protein